MNPTKRQYRATFILDNRGKDDAVDALVDGIKQVIATVEGEVSAVENLGRRDFARVTDRKFIAANYVQIDFAAPATAPAALRERLRLNSTVHRTFVESL